MLLAAVCQISNNLYAFSQDNFVFLSILFWPLSLSLFVLK